MEYHSFSRLLLLTIVGFCYVKKGIFLILRRGLIPNTYGVIFEKASSEFSEQIRKGYEMGVDYSEAMTF